MRRCLRFFSSLGVLALFHVSARGTAEKCPNETGTIIGCSIPYRELKERKMELQFGNQFYIYSTLLNIDPCGVAITGYTVGYTGQCRTTLTVWGATRRGRRIVKSSPPVELPSTRIDSFRHESVTFSSPLSLLLKKAQVNVSEFGLKVENLDLTGNNRCRLSIRSGPVSSCNIDGLIMTSTLKVTNDPKGENDWFNLTHSLLDLTVTIKDLDECQLSLHQSSCTNYKQLCENTPGFYQCKHCERGYEATPLNQCVDIDECANSPEICGSHGRACQNTNSSYTCSCHRGYNGHPCKDINECLGSPSPCGFHGTCLNTPGSYNCSCSNGYSGRLCADVDECLRKPSPCGFHSMCQNTNGSYTCSCRRGFSGRPCKDINECFQMPPPCHYRASCRNEPGSYTCSCKPGYAGNWCRDRNECLQTASPCKLGLSCQNTIGSYRCCLPKYTGIGCTDVNECLRQPSPCGSNGSCLNLAGSFRCFCAPGFTGHLCSDDIDECRQQPSSVCRPAKTCENMIGSFRCSCTFGRYKLTRNNCSTPAQSTAVSISSLQRATVTSLTHAPTSRQTVRISTTRPWSEVWSSTSHRKSPAPTTDQNHHKTDSQPLENTNLTATTVGVSLGCLVFLGFLALLANLLLKKKRKRNRNFLFLQRRNAETTRSTPSSNQVCVQLHREKDVGDSVTHGASFPVDADGYETIDFTADNLSPSSRPTPSRPCYHISAFGNGDKICKMKRGNKSDGWRQDAKETANLYEMVSNQGKSVYQRPCLDCTDDDQYATPAAAGLTVYQSLCKELSADSEEMISVDGSSQEKKTSRFGEYTLPHPVQKPVYQGLADVTSPKTT